MNNITLQIDLEVNEDDSLDQLCEWIKYIINRYTDTRAISVKNMPIDPLTRSNVTFEELKQGYTVHEPDQTYGAAD